MKNSERWNTGTIASAHNCNAILISMDVLTLWNFLYDDLKLHCNKIYLFHYKPIILSSFNGILYIAMLYGISIGYEYISSLILAQGTIQILRLSNYLNMAVSKTNNYPNRVVSFSMAFISTIKNFFFNDLAINTIFHITIKFKYAQSTSFI